MLSPRSWSRRGLSNSISLSLSLFSNEIFCFYFIVQLMVSFARSLKTSLLLTSLNLDGAKFDQVCLGKKKKKKKKI